MPNHRRHAAVAYLLLASIYLLYLPHAEFVLDDWFVLGKYQAAREAGPAEQIRVAVSIVQNQFHGQFRFQWVSFSIGYLLWLLVGYSPGVVFALIVLVHLACAIALREVVEKLGTGAGPAFLSGAVFLLLPTTHGPLFWSFNCAFFVWCTFWFLLYLRSLVTSLASGRLEPKAAAWQVLLLLLALFSGDPSFVLLLVAAPMIGWFLRSRAAVRASLLAWVTVAVAAAGYGLLINKAPLVQSGVGLRYDFSPVSFWGHLFAIHEAYRKLTGLVEGSYYRLSLTGPAVAAAAIGVAATVLCLRGTDRKRRLAARAVMLAAGLWVAAYGPIWFLRGHEFRYDYVPSPHLALALAVAVLAWPVIRLPLAGALAGWLAVATVGDIQQCWIPQSRHLRVIAERLRAWKAVEPGDLIIVSNAPMWIGTAPNFAFMAGWASTPFAEHVTGVRGVEAACEIVNDGGRLRVYHRNYMRDLKPDEPARVRLLVAEGIGRLTERRLLAQEIHPGAYHIFPLKGYAGLPVPRRAFTREQLQMAESEIYFAKIFSHRAPAH